MGRGLREVSTDELSEMLKGERPVLVDFYATWCGPCKAMEPVVERVAERFEGRAEVVKVNIDESREFASSHAVRGVPTFLLFVGGKALNRQVGSTSEQALASIIEPHVARESADARSA